VAEGRIELDPEDNAQEAADLMARKEALSELIHQTLEALNKQQVALERDWATWWRAFKARRDGALPSGVMLQFIVPATGPAYVSITPEGEEEA
jgi:hypothetical protein